MEGGRDGGRRGRRPNTKEMPHRRCSASLRRVSKKGPSLLPSHHGNGRAGGRTRVPRRVPHDETTASAERATDPEKHETCNSPTRFIPATLLCAGGGTPNPRSRAR